MLDCGSKSGGGGIRTHGALPGATVFKTAPFGRSGTPPRASLARYRSRSQAPRGAEIDERLRHRDRAAVVLEVLQYRQHGPCRHRGPVQRVYRLEAGVAADADVEPPRL